jgi:hypothetical protein
MHCVVRASLVSLALLPAHPIAAQEQPLAEAPEEIVVTGDRNVDRQARDFVAAMTGRATGTQLARFEWAVCPAAVAFSATQKAAVEHRLRSVAGAAGIPVGKPDCAPNAILILTDDKGAFVDALGRLHPEYFGDLSSAAIRRLARASGPTAAWQLQGKVNARGVAIVPDGITGVAVNRTTDPGSRITAAARPVFEASALVVERRALDGLTTTQLADYAAMRLFARTDPDRLADVSAPTIVKILEAPMGSPVPLTLTKWDLGFLRGLYAGQNNLYSGAQRSEIRRGIIEELQGKEGETEPSREPRPPR